MAEQFEGPEKETLLKEITRLELENRRLTRQLAASEHLVETYKNIMMAQETLSAVVTAEKSKQEKHLQVIMEYSPDMIILLDSAAHFLLSTQSFLTLLNIPSPEFLHHKPFRQIFSVFADEEWLDHMEDLFQKAFAMGAIQESEDNLDLGDTGTVRHYAISAAPFTYERDKNDGLLVIFRDLTNIIEARDQAAAAHYYKGADQAKSAFLAKMSHEMRTPLNAIIGMSELTLRKSIPLDVQENVLTIKHTGSTLLSIINDILDFSRIQSGNLEIAPADYLFSSLVNDVVNIIKTRVLESRLRFVVNVDNDIPNDLFGDAIRIRQIMMNLLSNAVKYTERGYVSLSILKEMANPSDDGGYDDGGYDDDDHDDYHDDHDNTVILIITVEDSGKGIREEEIGKLFDEFTRGDLVDNKGIEGTGLGLAITRNLVDAMGGTIEVHSIYGEGSTFTVTLPQKVRSNQKMAVVENPEEKNVLIYERRELYRHSIVQTMESLGVPYKAISTDAEFYDEIMSRKYSFVFLASVLYERVKEKYANLESAEGYKSGVKFLLIAEFGEAIAGHNISLLTTPIYSLPVANFLNKVSHTTAGGYQHAGGLIGRPEDTSLGIGNSGAVRTSASEERVIPHEPVVNFTAPQARILIVDDIETNLKVAEGLLKPYGMQVDVCKSGKVAIEILKRERYDLIFMDHMMPAMNGMEATAKIRALGGKDPYYTSLPIIALTANAVVGTKKMFLENGFNDFLSKPIDTVKLDMMLARWLPPEKQIKRTPDDIRAGISCPVDRLNINIDGLNINIDGLNTKVGVAIAGGSIQSYLKILTTFYKDTLETIKEMKACLRAENLSLYRIYAHGIKSAAGNIGAEGIAEAAQELENAAEKGMVDFVHSRSDAFFKGLETLLDAINIGITQARTHTKDMGLDQTGNPDIDVLHAELSELKVALDVLDSVRIKKAVGELQKFTQTPRVGDTVEDILQNVLIGAYDEAVSLIDGADVDYFT
ncbi:MAG: ATP-binding protein [Peptococcaceae bacterium]|nr:ATP-binding protein [Peptococcaceae bacterium]